MIWSTTIERKNIEMDNNMVSFRVPTFPYTITEPIPVKIILEQKNKIIQSLDYMYILKCNKKRIYLFFVLYRIILF